MWVRLDLNPEPWTAPEVSIGRRGGKSFPQVYKKAQLRTYQEAVKEQLEALGVTPFEGPVYLEFYFWRQLAEGNTGGTRSRRAHQSDATNLQKALEDALQDLLIGNDKNTRKICSTVVEQGPNVEGKVIIRLEAFDESLIGPIPVDLEITPLKAGLEPVGQETLF